MGEHPGLAGAGAGQHQAVVGWRGNCLALRGIQRFDEGDEAGIGVGEGVELHGS